MAAPDGYRLIFEDDFETFHGTTGFDPDVWQHDGLGARRDAINVREAITVQDGALRIRTWTDPDTGKHHTGMIRSKGQWRHGYFEARIRFDTAPGSWSAFWLYNQRIWENSRSGPLENGVEVDIIEHRVRDQHGHDIADHAHHALHWDGYGEHHKQAARTTAGLLDGDWHTFAMLWDETGYTFFVDGVRTWDSRVDAPTFGVSPEGVVAGIEHWIVLSSEVLDNAWAGDVPPGGYGPLTADSPSMQVDWVRVYQAPEPGASALMLPAALLAMSRAVCRFMNM